MNEEVKTVFQYNNFVLNKSLEGVSHEESLERPEKGGNSINWILGHIIVTRDVVLECLGEFKMCDEKLTALYIRGSETIRPENAEDLNKMLNIYQESQVKIDNALLEKDYKDDLEITKELAGLGFHEAYHVGQIGILRRVIGKPGVIK